MGKRGMTQERGSLLSREEEATLSQLSKKGDSQARERLIICHMELVNRIAWRYRGHGLSQEDLVQEGTIGLIKAVDNFDHDRGFRLSTFAEPHVTGSILRAIREQGRAVRFPPNVVQQIRRLNQAEASLTQKLGREPTANELARGLGMPESHVVKLLVYKEFRVVPEEEANDVVTNETETDESRWNFAALQLIQQEPPSLQLIQTEPVPLQLVPPRTTSFQIVGDIGRARRKIQNKKKPPETI